MARWDPVTSANTDEVSPTRMHLQSLHCASSGMQQWGCPLASLSLPCTASQITPPKGDKSDSKDFAHVLIKVCVP